MIEESFFRSKERAVHTVGERPFLGQLDQGQA